MPRWGPVEGGLQRACEGCRDPDEPLRKAAKGCRGTMEGRLWAGAIARRVPARHPCRASMTGANGGCDRGQAPVTRDWYR